jgi:hypothetical protein
MDRDKTLRRIRLYLIVFFFGILFGLHTVAFVEIETAYFARFLGYGTFMEDILPSAASWIENLHHTITEVYKTYPVMAYCMDWLSYACLVFAWFTIGAIKNPVRNIWIIQVYMIACILAAMLPFIVGPFRGIPLFWRFIDCSFGIIGFLLLFSAYRLTKQLQVNQS